MPVVWRLIGILFGGQILRFDLTLQVMCHYLKKGCQKSFLFAYLKANYLYYKIIHRKKKLEFF